MKLAKILISFAIAGVSFYSGASVRYEISVPVVWQKDGALQPQANYFFAGIAANFITPNSFESVSKIACNTGIDGFVCRDPVFFVDATDPYLNGQPGTQAILIGVSYGDQYGESAAYYFSKNSFATIGTHYSLGLGRQATLVVSAMPVPEPETYALMVLGLSAIGFSARRQKVELLR